DDAPATFMRRAHELEAECEAARASVHAAEAALASVVRADLAGADELWRTLTVGVEALDYEARMQARQLIEDTFERITVYHSGIRPTAHAGRHIDVVLLARGGSHGRLLSLASSGELLTAEDVAKAPGL
ncbi:MAG: recombinase family protein, partial [Casimicrobiaceae bacterium]